MANAQDRMPESVTRALSRMFEEIIERTRVSPEHVVAEAAKRGLPMTGATPRTRLASLRECSVASLDPLARQYVASSALAAGVQGFVSNLGGAATLPLSLSADTLGTLAAAVRATSGVMGVYGFETESEAGAGQLRVGLLAAAGVSTVTIHGTQILVSQLSRLLVDRAAAQPLSAVLTGQLSRGIVARTLWERLPRAVPVVGGVIGGGVNAGMVRAMGARARAHYRSLLMEWQHNTGVAPSVVVVHVTPRDR